MGGRGLTIFFNDVKSSNLLHLNAPHGAADVDDKYDVFGKRREVGWSKKLNKVTIRHLEDKRRCCRLCLDHTTCTHWSKLAPTYLQLPIVAFPCHVVRHCEGAIDGTLRAVGALFLLLKGRLEDHVSLSDRDTHIFQPELVPCPPLFCFFFFLRTAVIFLFRISFRVFFVSRFLFHH